MHKSIVMLLMIGLLAGIGFSGQLALAQESPVNNEVVGDLDDDENGQNYFLKGLVFIIGLLLLWFLFHKLLYPFLLKYYHPIYCKSLFWSLLMLYGLAWVTVGSYVIFDFGFRLHMMKWVFVFIGVIWIIWFIIIMLRKDKVYY